MMMMDNYAAGIMLDADPPCERCERLLETVENYAYNLDQFRKQCDQLEAENKRLQEASRWITLEERLPDNWHHVLTVSQMGNIDISQHIDGLWLGTNGWHRPGTGVTHWRQLPEPPVW